MPEVITYDSVPIWAGLYAGFGLLDTQDAVGLRNENLTTPLGAGVDFMVSDNWILGAEYLRHEFSEETYVLNNTFDSEGNFDVFRIRASYAF